MLDNLSLEARLKLSIGFSLMVMLILGFLWSVHDAKNDVREEAAASVSLALGFIDATLLPGQLEPSGIPVWIEQIGHLAKVRHLRITATPHSDSIDSAPPAQLTPSARGVPDWFEWAVETDPIVAVREIKVGETLTIRIRVESYAEDEIREAWTQTRAFLWLMSIFAVAVYAAVHLIAGRALRPVGRILDGIHDIESGDYITRLEPPRLPELNRIVEGINHLSSTLREARDENRALTRHSLVIQEEERRALAKEMHDEVGQNLTAIKMMSALITESTIHREQATLEIQRLCDRLFDVVRSVIHRLRPMILEDLGLKAALEDLADHWRQVSPGIKIEVVCDDSMAMIEGDTAIEIYRIVQEALTNTVRHSGASLASIMIHRNEDLSLSLIMKDNGIGMPFDAPRRGFGILGMRERVSSLRGEFDLVTVPGQGLEIRIQLPFIEDVSRHD